MLGGDENQNVSIAILVGCKMVPRIVAGPGKANPPSHFFTEFVFDQSEQLVEPPKTFPATVHQQRELKA